MHATAILAYFTMIRHVLSLLRIRIECVDPINLIYQNQLKVLPKSYLPYYENKGSHRHLDEAKTTLFGFPHDTRTYFIYTTTYGKVRQAYATEVYGLVYDHQRTGKAILLSIHRPLLSHGDTIRSDIVYIYRVSHIEMCLLN